MKLGKSYLKDELVIQVYFSELFPRLKASVLLRVVMLVIITSQSSLLTHLQPSQSVVGRGLSHTSLSHSHHHHHHDQTHHYK